LVLVLVEISFANTRQSIGNTNTNTYFQKLLQYFDTIENGIGNTEYRNIVLQY